MSILSLGLQLIHNYTYNIVTSEENVSATINI